VALDLAKMYDWIVAEVARPSSVAESMSRLIDQCEAARPHSDWARFRALPFGDLDSLVGWLRRLFITEPYDRPLRGLWFGLFNPCNDDEPIADIYVCGSERFEPDPRSNEWAVGAEWRPEARYAGSPILAELYRIAYRDNALKNDAEYPLCLGCAAFAVRHVLTMVEPSLILGTADSLGVAVGFDSGDFILLGELGPQGVANCI